MAEFINRVVTFEFAVMFVLFLICLFGYGIPTYRGGNIGFSLLWFFATVLCFVMCIKLAFGV